MSQKILISMLLIMNCQASESPVESQTSQDLSSESSPIASSSNLPRTASMTNLLESRSQTPELETDIASLSILELSTKETTFKDAPRPTSTDCNSSKNILRVEEVQPMFTTLRASAEELRSRRKEQTMWRPRPLFQIAKLQTISNLKEGEFSEIELIPLIHVLVTKSNDCLERSSSKIFEVKDPELFEFKRPASALAKVLDAEDKEEEFGPFVFGTSKK